MIEKLMIAFARCQVPRNVLLLTHAAVDARAREGLDQALSTATIISRGCCFCAICILQHAYYNTCAVLPGLPFSFDNPKARQRTWELHSHI
jgi:hypothetical protein